jgi:molybdopterin-guanine dinucleotide biosynthesis protein A
MTEPRITAIVLAGGRSSRFGRDKLAEPIAGRSLLQHAISAVRPFAREVLVVAAPGASATVPPGIRVLHDPVAYEGPLAGLVTGLRAAATSIVLVVAGDMPDLVPGVIDLLLDALISPDIDAAILEHDGRPRPLPMALRREAGLIAAESLIEAGERRLRALPDLLHAAVIPEPAWRALDADGRSVRDIDVPADLP